MKTLINFTMKLLSLPVLVNGFGQILEDAKPMIDGVGSFVVLGLVVFYWILKIRAEKIRIKRFEKDIDVPLD